MFDDVRVAAVQLLLGAQGDVVTQEVTELHQHVGPGLVGSFILQLHVVRVGRFVVQSRADQPGTRQPGLISSSAPGLGPAVLVGVGETSGEWRVSRVGTVLSN